MCRSERDYRMKINRASLRVFLAAILFSTLALADVASTQPVTTAFLQGVAAKKAIIDDSLDPYFSKLQDHEMSAKTGETVTGDSREAKLTECKLLYQAAVLDFSDDDKATLVWLISKIQPSIARKYPVFGKTPWSFIKVADSLEGGMPHTRGRTVVLPESVLTQFDTLRRRQGDRAIPGGAMLLIHEQTHVLERLHPDLFTQLFTETFHFVRAANIKPDAWLTARQLINPDGIRCEWLLPANINGDCYILPLIVFADPDAPDIHKGIETIGVIMTKKPDGYVAAVDDAGKPRVSRLAELKPYTDEEGSGGNNYHPNEIAADRFAELVVIDDLINKDLLPADAGQAGKMEAKLKVTRDWASKAFAEPVSH